MIRHTAEVRAVAMRLKGIESGAQRTSGVPAGRFHARGRGPDVESFVHDQVLALQRLAGNRAVGAILRSITVQRDWTWSSVKGHVLSGDYTADKKAPTGYHSEVGKSLSHKSYGAETEIGRTPGGDAIYAKSVRATNQSGGKDQYQVKWWQSNFFPRTVGGKATTEQHLKTAVESAGARNDKAVREPEAWRGMVLTGGGKATAYPAADETNRLHAQPPEGTKDPGCNVHT
jgi:hypothetical protein